MMIMPAITRSYRLPALRESMIKYVGLPTRKAGLSVEEYQTRWRDRHGPLVMAAFPQMPRYVQSHVLPETYEDARPPAYDGVPELWFPDLEGFPWGLVRPSTPDPSRPPANPAALDAQSLFELPIPGLVTREIAFDV